MCYPCVTSPEQGIASQLPSLSLPSQPSAQGTLEAIAELWYYPWERPSPWLPEAPSPSSHFQEVFKKHKSKPGNLFTILWIPVVQPVWRCPSLLSHVMSARVPDRADTTNPSRWPVPPEQQLMVSHTDGPVGWTDSSRYWVCVHGTEFYYGISGRLLHLGIKKALELILFWKQTHLQVG